MQRKGSSKKSFILGKLHWGKFYFRFQKLFGIMGPIIDAMQWYHFYKTSKLPQGHWRWVYDKYTGRAIIGIATETYHEDLISALGMSWDDADVDMGFLRDGIAYKYSALMEREQDPEILKALEYAEQY